MSAFTRHVGRLTDETLYRAGFHSGIAGEPHENPFGPSHPEGIPFTEGWRRGRAAHRLGFTSNVYFELVDTAETHASIGDPASTTYAAT